jgi:hypothetical protein
MIDSDASPFSGLLVVFNSASQKIGYSFMKSSSTGLARTELMSFVTFKSYDSDCESSVYFVSFEKVFLGLDLESAVPEDDCFKIMDPSVLFVCKYKLHYKLTTICNVGTWQGTVPMLVQLDSKYLGVLLPIEFILGTSQHHPNNELLVMRDSYSGWIFVMYDFIVRHDTIVVCMVEKDCVFKLIGRSTMSLNNFPGLFQPEDAVFDKSLFANSKLRQEILRQIGHDHYDTTNLIRALHYQDKKRKFEL